MSAPKSFTVEEMLRAAEKNEYKNFNEYYLEYANGTEFPDNKSEKPLKACVIGEAFLQLGYVPNGISPQHLSDALRRIRPDDGVTLPQGDGNWPIENLADFINQLNGIKGYSGKKRMAKLVRQYFSQSLDKKIVFRTDIVNTWGGGKRKGFVIAD